jgi:UDPglucose 6-dehydrogenase
MNICVVGTGYVGLVTGAVFADLVQFLQPGLGYGGSCFPKDVDSLIHTAARLGYDVKLLRSVVEINKERAQHLVDLMQKALGPLDDRTIAVVGLAFKPNTHDMREANSIEVIRSLTAAGVQVRTYDPVAMDNARPLVPGGVVFSNSAYDAADGADAIALLTEWNEFKFLNLERLRRLRRRPMIFDGRNLYEPERMRRLGFEYYSIGRKLIVPA